MAKENETVEIDIVVKKWYLSKTLWTNAAVVGIGIATILTQQYAAGITITFAGVVNAILRVISDEGIEF